MSPPIDPYAFHGHLIGAFVPDHAGDPQWTFTCDTDAYPGLFAATPTQSESSIRLALETWATHLLGLRHP